MRSEGQASVARFDSVDFVSTNTDEWVISFRGRDQPGALKAAVESLVRHGLEIRWATVHTWGRQIDDVFGVCPPWRDGVRPPRRDGVRPPEWEGYRPGAEEKTVSPLQSARDQQQAVLLKIRAEMT